MDSINVCRKCASLSLKFCCHPYVPMLSFDLLILAYRDAPSLVVYSFKFMHIVLQGQT